MSFFEDIDDGNDRGDENDNELMVATMVGMAISQQGTEEGEGEKLTTINLTTTMQQMPTRPSTTMTCTMMISHNDNVASGARKTTA